MSRAPGLWVASVVARTTGKRALYAALPVYLLIGIGAAVAFAGNGMDARTVTDAALASPALRLGSLLAWVLSTLPVARLLVADPAAFFLRALPVGRATLLASGGIGLLATQLGWAVLWARGAGGLAAGCAVLAALGAQCQLIARVQTRADVLRWVAIAGAWWLAPSLLALGVASLGFGSAYLSAWRRAPEPEAAGADRVLRRGAGLALGSALASAALRTDRSASARALALAALAHAGTWLGAAHNPGWGAPEVVQLGAGLWGAAALLAGVALARPLLQAEAQLTWLLDACGVALRLRALASIALLAALAAGVGAGAGVALALADERAAALPGQLCVLNAAWAALAAAVVRITSRGRGHDAGRQLLALLAAYAVVLLVPFPERAHALAASSVASVLSCAVAARRRLPAALLPGGA